MTFGTKSAAILQEMLNAKETTVTELTKQSLAEITKQDQSVQAFLHVAEEQALATAQQLDEVAIDQRGPLFGLPIAIKDNFVTKGMPTTAGSKMLEGFESLFDATVVQKVKAAGMVPVGKVNMDEFAMGSTTETSAFQKTRNPWNTEHVPGGSSGGSAAAVASGEVGFALGTDTGGSVRQPAAYCGIVGMKPTYGRVSRLGMIAMASSLDQAGPMTKTVEDNAKLLQVIAGEDLNDSSSSSEPVPNYIEALTGDLTGIKIGVPSEFFGEGVSAEVQLAVKSSLDVLASLGAEWEEMSLPHTKYAPATYAILMAAEASSNLSRYDGVHYGYRSPNARTLEEVYKLSRQEAFGQEVKRRILFGTYTMSSGHYDPFYKKAQRVRTLIAQDYAKAFEKYDVLIGPAAPTTAPKLGEEIDQAADIAADMLATPANLAGVPALSIPCGMANDLPIGLQIIGNHFQEATIYQVAHAYEMTTDFHMLTPVKVGGNE